MSEVDPRLAYDLRKLAAANQSVLRKDAPDLSSDALKADAIRRNIERAAAWAHRMHKTFKGIAGAPNRKARAIYTYARYGITEADVQFAREFYAKQREEQDV